jgi:hypothetical protein
MTTYFLGADLKSAEVEALDIDWIERIQALRGVTYLTLDDAVCALANGMLKEIQEHGAAQTTDEKEQKVTEKELRQTLLLTMYNDEDLLHRLIAELDIHEY